MWVSKNVKRNISLKFTFIGNGASPASWNRVKIVEYKTKMHKNLKPHQSSQ